MLLAGGVLFHVLGGGGDILLAGAEMLYVVGGGGAHANKQTKRKRDMYNMCIRTN